MEAQPLKMWVDMNDLLNLLIKEFDFLLEYEVDVGDEYFIETLELALKKGFEKYIASQKEVKKEGGDETLSILKELTEVIKELSVKQHFDTEKTITAIEGFDDRISKIESRNFSRKEFLSKETLGYCLNNIKNFCCRNVCPSCPLYLNKEKRCMILLDPPVNWELDNFSKGECKMKTKTIARFEKVSEEQFAKDYTDTTELDDLGNEIYNNIKIPKRASKGSAGYDFFAPYTFEIPPHSEVKIPTGIRCLMCEGYVLKVYPRSSLGFKHRMSLNNTVGIIDSDYHFADNEGHIFIKVFNPKDTPITIKEGDGFAQGIFVEYFLAEEEEVTQKRVGGIGSTNK